MNKTDDFSQIINDLEKTRSKRQRKSLYLSDDLYKEFRLICGSVPPSKVIEELMRIAISKAKKSA